LLEFSSLSYVHLKSRGHLDSLSNEEAEGWHGKSHQLQGLRRDVLVLVGLARACCDV